MSKFEIKRIGNADVLTEGSRIFGNVFEPTEEVLTECDSVLADYYAEGIGQELKSLKRAGALEGIL